MGSFVLNAWAECYTQANRNNSFTVYEGGRHYFVIWSTAVRMSNRGIPRYHKKLKYCNLPIKDVWYSKRQNMRNFTFDAHFRQWYVQFPQKFMQSYLITYSQHSMWSILNKQLGSRVPSHDQRTLLKLLNQLFFQVPALIRLQTYWKPILLFGVGQYLGMRRLIFPEKCVIIVTGPVCVILT